jgi:hypothetical protein
MRVLILGPDHAGGSLPPYLDVLAAGLRHHGVTVDRRGSTQIPYDQAQQRFWPLERVLAAAHALADRVDLDGYDLVSLHFGNLEVDQLVPALWADRRRPPVVYHVHTLAPTLFRDHVPDQHWDRVVQRGIRSADGYVYFGQYARHRVAGTVPDDVPVPAQRQVQAWHTCTASASIRRTACSTRPATTASSGSRRADLLSSSVLRRTRWDSRSPDHGTFSAAATLSPTTSAPPRSD